MNRITITISPELDSALSIRAMQQDIPKSRLIDTLLREHPLVKEAIEEIRAEPKTTGYAASRKAEARKFKKH